MPQRNPVASGQRATIYWEGGGCTEVRNFEVWGPTGCVCCDCMLPREEYEARRTAFHINYEKCTMLYRIGRCHAVYLGGFRSKDWHLFHWVGRCTQCGIELAGAAEAGDVAEITCTRCKKSYDPVVEHGFTCPCKNDCWKEHCTIEVNGVVVFDSRKALGQPVWEEEEENNGAA